VVQASQPNSHFCADCSSLLEGVLAQHVCPKCSRPQPLRSEESYFDALGVLKRFKQNDAQLEKVFYEVSRALHPDRFTHAGVEVLQRSIQRMSFLNEAYRTLKSPVLLRDYLLHGNGIRAQSGDSPASRPQSSKLPMELAEMWFEIQDLLLDDPAAAKDRLVGFEKELTELQHALDQKIQSLENQYDQKADQGIEGQDLLVELDEVLKKENYLKSMKKDVDRIKKNGHSN
jgi:molecular chaperone HscB